MTKRAVIITTSVIVAIITVLTILFGVVFRVRNIDVEYNDNFVYKTEINNIIKDSKLKKNDSIFEVNRNKIKTSIEKYYPYARVECVTVSSMSSVKITLSNREPMYYLVEEAIYYILDEDCKVLAVTNDVAQAQNYILLNNVFDVSESTTPGQFLNNNYTKVCLNLYKSLYSYIGEDADNDGVLDNQNITREDIWAVIRSVKFERVNELFGEVDNLVMTTSYGVKISIIEPQKNLDLKTNMALSGIRTLLARGQGEESSGTIVVRYSYDQNNNPTPKCEYHA